MTNDALNEGGRVQVRRRDETTRRRVPFSDYPNQCIKLPTRESNLPKRIYLVATSEALVLAFFLVIFLT